MLSSVFTRDSRMLSAS